MITLREYQHKAVDQGVELLKDYKICCLSMEVRTGKTLTAFALADAYGANNVLFVSKKKPITEGSIKSDYELLKPKFKCDFINFSSLHKVTGKYDLIIIDESHSIGAFPKPGVRTKHLKKICIDLPIIYLSGTFSPESYSQIYHQFWVSSFSPFSEYTNFYKWSYKFVYVVKKFIGGREIKQYHKGIKDLIDQYCKHLFISVSQDQAGFEQPIEEKFLRVPMSDLQKTLIRQIDTIDHCVFGDQVSIPANGADKISKKAQISGGTLIFDDEDKGRVLSINKAHFIQQNFTGQKIAILYVYKAEGELLKSFFKNWTSDENVFREDPTSTYIAQIRSAREGVDLSSADCLVMYSVDFSATSYFQGKARIQSKSRTKPAILYWIFSEGGIEDHIYKAVSNKKNFTYSYYKTIQKV